MLGLINKPPGIRVSDCSVVVWWHVYIEREFTTMERIESLLLRFAAHGAFRHSAYRTGLATHRCHACLSSGVRGNDRYLLRHDEQSQLLEQQTFTKGDRGFRASNCFDEFLGLFVGFLRHFDL